MKPLECNAYLDDEGRLVLPAEVSGMLGLPDSKNLRVVVHENRMEIYPNIHDLAKVYIEPTSECNLTCQKCIRETWTEPLGDMDIDMFDTLVDQLKEFKTLHTVMFGGLGEPTFHKDILYMIGRIKSLGVRVEMVSNGTFLDDEMIHGLIDNGLDMLWVSFDGTSPDNFDDIREGANFNAAVNNLKRLKQINETSAHKIRLGIAFVIMKKNIHEISNINKFAMNLEAEKISVSNVLPYSREMLDQIVCDLSVRYNDQMFKSMMVPMSIPLIDVSGTTRKALYELFRSKNDISILRNKIGIGTRSCRFIEEKCTFIRWDGMVSPCMGLIHSYKTFFTVNGTERDVSSYTLGNIGDKSLKTIWDSKEYHDFRDRVDSFDFSPCIQCGPCELAEKNQEDCYGNQFPTCGGCLWAQGVIQCP
jgi:MoaA/NifB/PqqE/SkfB family radical SAM enzyme